MSLATQPESIADDRVLEIVRVFDAPRSLVFKAWTEPAQVARWMGPRGFTATHYDQDQQPGGVWRACLRRDEDGQELWQGGVVREVVPPERLAFTFAWDQDDGRPGHETLVTVSFAEEGAKTRMTFRQAVFASAESRDGHRGGWSSAFDRLEELVSQMAPTGGM